MFGYDIQVGHYVEWIDESMPVFLILYDARQEGRIGSHIQDYFPADPSQRPKRGCQDTQGVTSRWPTSSQKILSMT